MRAFLYGLALQWRLDIRSKTLLITCYFVPLLFFAVMGGIFTSLMPETRETLIASMSIFGISMGALIGVPPTLVETYGSDIIKGYRANGVPVWLPLILTELSACFHLLFMGLILYMAAPLLFDAKTPDEPAEYFGALVLFIVVSVAAAGVIGLAVKEQSRTSMFSILFFLPSILLSGILFPAEALPEAFAAAGNLLPSTWGYRLMTENGPLWPNLWPLCLLFAVAAGLGGYFLRRAGRAGRGKTEG